jgi:hypothetical protein
MMLCGKLKSFPPEKQVICLPVLELTLVHIYIYEIIISQKEE